MLGKLLDYFVHKNTKSEQRITSPLDIGYIKGQKATKIALLIAATGRHNVLLIGPPGEGKSTIAGCIPGFTPALQEREYKDLDHIYRHNPSYSGIYKSGYRPFIEVGPNITESGLLGGGRKPYPGAISLAHSGILFMDELPQFSKKLLESLRTPMESGEIIISRNGETILYPCKFQLVAAMNPCPCGYAPLPTCTCSTSEISRYHKKLSGPILDRIDMFLEMNALSSEDRFSPSTPGLTDEFLHKLEDAILFRLNDRSQEYFNNAIHSKEVYNTKSTIIKWSTEALDMFKHYMDSRDFSTRKGVRLARLSRTVADLLNEKYILPKHILMVDEYLSFKDIVK